MRERRQPENSTLRKQWVTLKAYGELYDADPRTVRKWAEAGLVELVSVTPKDARKIIRVKNSPPWEGA